jgi:hypothetical protein
VPNSANQRPHWLAGLDGCYRQRRHRSVVACAEFSHPDMSDDNQTVIPRSFIDLFIPARRPGGPAVLADLSEDEGR